MICQDADIEGRFEGNLEVAGTLSFVPPFSHYCPVSVKIAAALAGACVILSWVRVLGGYEPSRAAVRGGSGSGLVGRKAPALGIAVQDLNLVTPDASPAETPERPRSQTAGAFPSGTDPSGSFGGRRPPGVATHTHTHTS